MAADPVARLHRAPAPLGAVAADGLVVGDLSEGELPAAVGPLARAFRDNPLNTAVIRGGAARRLRVNRRGMRMMLPEARRHGVVLGASRAGRIVGALAALPPYLYPAPPLPLPKRLYYRLGKGWRVTARWRHVFEFLDVLHPMEPHWYLGSLGVDPRDQGSGVGIALVNALLTRANDDGMPTYLETDRRESVAFYERRGFSVVGRIEILGVPIWRMLYEAAEV